MVVEKLKPSAFWIQWLVTCCISFLAFQTGFITAWPSYTVALLMSNETVLDRPMTSMDISWLGGLPNLGGLIGSPFCGYIFSTLGRKYATVFYAVPFLITWIMTYFSNNVFIVLLAMTISGIGIGGQNVSIIYISEISHDSIRGGTTASSATGYCIGLLISYIIGGYLSYYQILVTNLLLNILCIGLLVLLKESPAYLVLKGQEEEAAKSIAFYNQVDVTSEFVKREIRKIKIQLDPRLGKILEDRKDAEISKEFIKANLGDLVEARKEPAWKIFTKSKSSKRVLFAVVVIMTSVVFMGNTSVQVFAEPIFKLAVPSMSSNLCSIILAVDFVVASLLCVLIIDKYGRKILLIVTSVVSGVCTVLLGIQLQFHFMPPWVTALMIYVYSFMYGIGSCIPFVLMGEVFLPEVRSFCSSFVIGWLWLVNFTMLFIFNPMVELLGLGLVFYGFSAVCFSTALYAQFKLPETKGLSADAIQVEFLKM